MHPNIDRVTGDDALPKQVDTLVIGGGIAGVSAAYYLARAGQSVALIEKGIIAGEQSSRNWGWCRTQNRDALELPLQILSMRLWDQLSAELPDDLGFRRDGLIYVTKDDEELATWSAWIDQAKQHQLPNRIVSGEEAKKLTPGNEQEWIGGVHAPADGRAEPGMAAPAIARALGAAVLQNCAVRGLDVVGGRVAGVVTERGRIAASNVLCAAGAWSSMFLRRHGIDLPQAGVRSTVFATTPGPEVTACGLVTPDVTLTRRLDGSYIVAAKNRARMEVTPQGIRYSRQMLPTLKKRYKSLKVGVGASLWSGPEALYGKWSFDKASPFEKHRIYAPPPDKGVPGPALEVVKSVYPQLSGVGVGSLWAGWIDATPDSLPVISAVESMPGLFLSTGYSGHGFGIGPGAGRLAADLMMGNSPPVDPTPFRYSRLVDGSKLAQPGMM